MAATEVIHEIEVARDLSVLFDGEKIGSVRRVRHNTYSALDMDGEVVAENCYANGGAKSCAAFYVAIRTGVLKDGMTHRDAGSRGGPYTYRERI